MPQEVLIVRPLRGLYIRLYRFVRPLLLRHACPAGHSTRFHDCTRFIPDPMDGKMGQRATGEFEIVIGTETTCSFHEAPRLGSQVFAILSLV